MSDDLYIISVEGGPEIAEMFVEATGDLQETNNIVVMTEKVEALSGDEARELLEEAANALGGEVTFDDE